MNAFDFKRVVGDACAVDGLRDFGGDGWREPLEVLLFSLANEARLNAVGTSVLRQRVVDILATRLRVHDYVQRYPEILDEEIVAPLVIVGLPRTGTTMLHRTIAADPRMLAPLWYETRFPCPALDWDPAQVDQRVVDGKAEMQAMLEGNPELLSVHPMDAMGPDEDIMLLEQSFYSYNLQAYADLPSYDSWVEAQDHTPGYEYLKLLLQFLQWQKRQIGVEGERWALKAPHHLHFLDLVFKVFPDARVVQSHRDPVETIPSLASMIAAVCVIYSDSADPARIGRLWARKFSEGMDRSLDVRKQIGEERFLDLWFKDTVTQPLQEIRKVYDFLGMELNQQARSEMEAWQDFNRRELRPPHNYTLQEYGLSEAGLKQQFARYRSQFINP